MHANVKINSEKLKWFHLNTKENINLSTLTNIIQHTLRCLIHTFNTKK